MRSSFFLGAVLVDHLALLVLAIGAVDQHRDRDAVDAAGFGDLGLGGAGDFVIVGFFALLALVAGGRGGVVAWLPGSSLLTVTWPSVRRRREDSSRVWLERSTAAFGVELVRGLGDLVVVEVGGELDPGAALRRPPRRRSLRPALRIRFSKAARRSSPTAPSASVSAPSASSWPASSTIETRCGFRPLTAEATTWRMARTCCGSSAPRTRTHDRGRRLRRFAREQRPFRQHEMDAGGLDAVDGADGAGELALRARRWLMFWTKLVVPSASDLSKIS